MSRKKDRNSWLPWRRRKRRTSLAGKKAFEILACVGLNHESQIGGKRLYCEAKPSARSFLREAMW